MVSIVPKNSIQRVAWPLGESDRIMLRVLIGPVDRGVLGSVGSITDSVARKETPREERTPISTVTRLRWSWTPLVLISRILLRKKEPANITITPRLDSVGKQANYRHYPDSRKPVNTSRQDFDSPVKPRRVHNRPLGSRLAFYP